MKKLDFEFWFEFWNSPLGKGLTEILRWGASALVSQLLIILSEILSRVLTFLPTLEQTIGIVVLTMLVRALDAILHKSGIAERGIVRF